MEGKSIAIKILIVDDEELILELMAEALTGEGYECFVASSVEAAVQTIRATPGIVLIITDLKMPGGNGFDLIETVQTQCGQKLKFIIMSGHADLSNNDRDVGAAALPFLAKPVSIESLLDKVRSVLEAKQ